MALAKSNGDRNASMQFPQSAVSYELSMSLNPKTIKTTWMQAFHVHANEISLKKSINYGLPRSASEHILGLCSFKTTRASRE